MTDNPQHDAISFWCDSYKSGVRITHDGAQFIYHTVDYPRIHKTKIFGLLTVEPCTPPLDIVAEAEARRASLLPLLTQPVPTELIDWWYHPLTVQYEGVPLLRMAARRGVAVWLLPCSQGVWPLIVNLPPDTEGGGMPELSPILVNSGYSFNMDAYRILGEKHERKNGYNRVDNYVEPKVREASQGERSTGRNGEASHTA